MNENTAEGANDIKINSEINKETNSNEELNNTTNTKVDPSPLGNNDGLQDGAVNIETSEVNINQQQYHTTTTKGDSSSLPQKDHLKESATEEEVLKLVENTDEESAEGANDIKINSEINKETNSNEELNNTTNTKVDPSPLGKNDGLHDGAVNIETSEVNINQQQNHTTTTKGDASSLPQLDHLKESATKDEPRIEKITEDPLKLVGNTDEQSPENSGNPEQNVLTSEKDLLAKTEKLEESVETKESSGDNIDKEENNSTTTKEDSALLSKNDVAAMNEEKTQKVPNLECDKNDKYANPTKTNAATKTKQKAGGGNDDDAYAKHVTYTEDGNAIYTDPETHYKYKWSEEQNNWIPCDESSKTASSTTSSASDSLYENEHYKWCSETHQWLPKAQPQQQQQTATEHYKWDTEKNEWILKKQEAAATAASETYDIDEQGQRIYTDKDGAIYFWDAERKAWFPKIDDDFMARYQMNYGFIDNTSAGEEDKRLKAEEELKLKEIELKRMTEEAESAAENDAAASGAGGASLKRKATQEPPKWFDMDPAQNTKVYVSNLPSDITLDEFAEVMGKCGMIMRDAQTQKYKLKLYAEANGQLKGDGLCDYIKVESVDLALNILDDYNLRGHKLHVQLAKFQMRGEYNPALKPKRKKKDKEKLLKMKEKLFDWRPEKMRGERTKNEKVVILKNLFHPEIFVKEVQLILDYQNDLREECGKCGTVRKVVIYDRHAEGIAQVNMASPEEADLVIQMMQGRFFGKRQLTAEHWDGKMKYKTNESETEVKQRLTNWDKFLETEEEHKNDEKEEAKEIVKQDKAILPAPAADSTTLSPAENTLALSDN